MRIGNWFVLHPELPAASRAPSAISKHTLLIELSCSSFTSRVSHDSASRYEPSDEETDGDP
jgi:hypothetical protein